MRSFVIVMPVCWSLVVVLLVLLPLFMYAPTHMHTRQMQKGCTLEVGAGGRGYILYGIPAWDPGDVHSYALPSQQHENSASECTKIQTKQLRKKGKPKKRSWKIKKSHKKYALHKIATMKHPL